VTTMSLIKDNRADMNMVNAGVMLIVLLVVLYVGIAIVDNVQDATDAGDAVAATGTLTLSGLSSDGELINVSSVTFELDTEGNYTAGNVQVSITDTARLTTATNLTAAINVNGTTSALVTATNTSTSIALTADAAGSGGNSIATTTNMSNGAWGAATLTGGSQSGVFYDTQQDLLSTTESSYSMAGIMPIVMIAVAVLSGLLGVLYLFSRRE